MNPDSPNSVEEPTDNNPEPSNNSSEPTENYPDRPTLYKILREKGYYLPAKKATCCTKSYLGRVQRNEVFTMKMENLKPFENEKDVKLEKGDLIRILKEKTEEDLGFPVNSSPDKKWLLDVLNTLDPENKFLENLPLKERRYGPFPPIADKIKMILARKESILRMDREKENELGEEKHKKLKGELDGMQKEVGEKEQDKISAQ